MDSKGAHRNDILASFLRHGLTKEEAMSEITVSLYGHVYAKLECA